MGQDGIIWCTYYYTHVIQMNFPFLLYSIQLSLKKIRLTLETLYLNFRFVIFRHWTIPDLVFMCRSQTVNKSSCPPPYSCNILTPPPRYSGNISQLDKLPDFVDACSRPWEKPVVPTLEFYVFFVSIYSSYLQTYSGIVRKQIFYITRLIFW